MNRLALSSGGDLRDFFRLVKECLVSKSTAMLDGKETDLRISDSIIREVEGQLRKDHLPIANDDAQWLARIHESKKTELNTTAVLPKLLNPALDLQALAAPYWLDLSSQQGDEWQKARLDMLARLNEQRETLRRNLQRPLIIILPDSERQQLKELTPDLWAIRDVSLIAGNELISVATPAVETPSTQARFSSHSPLLSSSDKALLTEWERLKSKKAKDRGVLSAGWAATDVCLEKLSLDKALEIARDNLSIAQELANRAKETPGVLRDLSVSLEKMGNAAMAMGDWQQAQDFYNQALEIRQRLITRLGETHQTLRDLAVSLKKMGNTSKLLNKNEESERFLKESEAIRSRLEKLDSSTASP